MTLRWAADTPNHPCLNTEKKTAQRESNINRKCTVGCFPSLELDLVFRQVDSPYGNRDGHLPDTANGGGENGEPELRSHVRSHTFWQRGLTSRDVLSKASALPGLVWAWGLIARVKG